MNGNIKEIQSLIEKALPAGAVATEHTDRGHFYRVMLPDKHGVTGNVYPSVTGKLQILKDESLINYKKNQVIQYFFRNFSKINEANLMEHLGLADRVPEDILADAGDIGTHIHDCRQRIFEEWIKTGVKPGQFLSFIGAEQVDVRLKSGIRALKRFVDEHNYRPIATELFVFSHKLKVAGTLDDIGIWDKVIVEGDKDCEHDFMTYGKPGKLRCWSCAREVKPEFVLMDLKSSNQLKDHYFFQVSLYYEMFRKLVGIAPQRCIIVKLSKEDGTYKIEDLKRPAKLVEYAKAMLKTNDAVAFIKELRKDNQKNVAEKLEL